MRSLILLLALLMIGFSSCRKYRIVHFGCKQDAFAQDSMFMPNMFTPNGDGNNDLLVFYKGNKNVTNFSLKIISPLSVEVFQTNDPDFEWDGLRYGELVSLDEYRCNFSFDADGKHYKEKRKLLIFWQADSNDDDDEYICPHNLDNCAVPAMWDGEKFNRQLPNNEFFVCD